MPPDTVDRPSRAECLLLWARHNPVQTFLAVSAIQLVIMLVVGGWFYAEHRAENRRADVLTMRTHVLALRTHRLAERNHRITVALCRDVNQRVEQRKESDGAAGTAFHIQAHALYEAVARIPRAQRNPVQLRLTWRIWAGDQHAARLLADRGITRTVTAC